MNDVLKALADLLGVSKDALQGVVDYMGSSLPDIMGRVQKEAPLYIFLGNYNLFLFFLCVVSIVLVVIFSICLYDLYDAYNINREEVGKTKKTLKYLLIVLTITILQFPLISGIKAVFTPTLYTIDYVMDKLNDK